MILPFDDSSTTEMQQLSVFTDITYRVYLIPRHIWMFIQAGAT
jgi:hypothetical protein